MENEISVKTEKKETEQTEKIKHLLSDWAEEKSNGKLKDFGSQIEILDITEKSAIRFDFRTRYVKREFDYNKTRPFNGETIPKEVKPLNDLWSYNTDNDNSNGHDDEEININNYKLMKKKLKDPYGIGFNSRSSDEIFNKVFFSSGNMPSENEERVPSATDIENLKIEYFHNNASCYPFPQTFRLDRCPECAGRGKVICWKCDGSGRILEDGKRVYCPECEGARNLICRVCEGKKKVIYHTALLEHFTYKDESKFFLPDDLDEPFISDIEKLDGYELASENGIEITQDNASIMLEKLEKEQNADADIAKAWKLLTDSIKTFMSEKSQNLIDQNTRINKYTIKQWSLDFQVVKYKYQNSEYSVIIYGKDSKIYAPKNTYPQELEYSFEKAQKTKKKKMSRRLDCLNPSNKSRLLTIILCLVLGFFGMHRFYVGKNKTGVLFSVFILIYLKFYKECDFVVILLLAVLGWTFLDFIMIILGKFRDKDGKNIINWI